MANAGDFAYAIAMEAGLNEIDLVIRAAWFERRTTGTLEVPLETAVEFLKTWSIRPNINTPRLKTKLRTAKGVSFKSNGLLHLPAITVKKLDDTYPEFVAPKPPQINDSILQSSDFESQRRYVQELVRQINGAHQFEFFDCCAVMMRRLAEVLIIEAYLDKGHDDQIRDGDGNLKMMNGLISALKSGQAFKLSRNAPKYLEDLKTLGDTAARSRNYITKQKDIEDFAQKFRILIDELKSLA